MHVQHLVGKNTWNSGGPSLRMDSRAGEKYLQQQEYLNFHLFSACELQCWAQHHVLCILSP